jgi:hypothetical protein
MKSLQRHGIHEAHKQLSVRMKKRGLNKVRVYVVRRTGKIRISFGGAPEEVKQAEKILADWN